MRNETNFSMAGLETKRSRSHIKRGLLCLGLALCLVSPASAGLFTVTIQNNSGVLVDDIHLLIAGTGGSIANRFVLQPGGGAILLSAGNEFNASFNPLAAGGVFVGQFTCDFAPLTLVSGYWTTGGNRGADIPVTSAVFREVQLAPAPAAMLPFVLGAAGALRKRRRA